MIHAVASGVAGCRSLLRREETDMEKAKVIADGNSVTIVGQDGETAVVCLIGTGWWVYCPGRYDARYNSRDEAIGLALAHVLALPTTPGRKEEE
jgi:hypothetical protein